MDVIPSEFRVINLSSLVVTVPFLKKRADKEVVHKFLNIEQKRTAVRDLRK